MRILLCPSRRHLNRNEKNEIGNCTYLDQQQYYRNANESFKNRFDEKETTNFIHFQKKERKKIVIGWLHSALHCIKLNLYLLFIRIDCYPSTNDHFVFFILRFKIVFHVTTSIQMRFLKIKEKKPKTNIHTRCDRLKMQEN